MQRLLDRYMASSGQCLNRQKTCIFFNSNIDHLTRNKIIQVSGVSPSGCYEKYLVLLTIVGRSNYNTFRSIKESVWHKMNSWKNNFLLQERKEVLLKAVIQAIPTFPSSVFKQPKKLCNDICLMMSRFCWGHKQDEKMIQWRSWTKMEESKKKGGLGFWDMKSFNGMLESAFQSILKGA